MKTADADADRSDSPEDQESKGHSLAIPAYTSTLIDQILERFSSGDVQETKILLEKLLTAQQHFIHNNVNRLTHFLLKVMPKAHAEALDTRDLCRKTALDAFHYLVDMCAKEMNHAYLHLAQIYDEMDNPDAAGKFTQASLQLHQFTGCLDEESTGDLLRVLTRSKYRARYVQAIQNDSATSAEVLAQLAEFAEAAALVESLAGAIESTVAATPLETLACRTLCEQLAETYTGLPPPARHALAYHLVGAFKDLQVKRARLAHENGSGGDILNLSRAMLSLNEALRAQERKDRYKRFKDLCDYHECVRLQAQLIQEPGQLEGIKAAIVEAREIAADLLGSEQFTTELEERRHRKAYFYGQLGEICRAHSLYGCLKQRQIPAVLRQAVESFQVALAVNDPPEPRLLNHCCPRIGECLRSLGQFREAIDAYLKVVDPGHGIARATAWEARLHIAKCYQALAKQARFDDEVGDEAGAAETYWEEAERWFVATAQVWENGLDPRQTLCLHPRNATVHGLLAWFYFDRGDFKQAEAQARMFLSRESPESVLPEHVDYYALNSFILGMALLRQYRNDEALRVLESALASKPSPKYRLRPLIALKVLYVRKRDNAGINDVTQRFIEAGTEAGIASIEALTEEQRSAMIDPSTMADYIKQCKERLKKGEARAILKELPRFVAASKLLNLSEKADPILLSLLAMADRDVGRYDEALRTFEYVLQLNEEAKNQAIVLMEIGKTYLRMGSYEIAAKSFEKCYDTRPEVGALVSAARAYRLAGDYDIALAHLYSVIDAPDRSQDKQPHLTRIEFARVAWAAYRDNPQAAGKSAAVGRACVELRRTMDGSLGSQYAGNLQASLCLVDMMAHPEALSTISELLRTTRNRDCVRHLGIALGRAGECPVEILKVVVERLLHRDTPMPIGRGLVKILSRAIIRAYYSGTCSGISFKALTRVVFLGLLMLDDEAARRRWVFELLVAERDAPLYELIERYAAEANKVFAPIMGDYESARTQLRSPAFVQRVSDFLRRSIPESIAPRAYGAGDYLCLNDVLNELVEDLRLELSEEIEKANRMAYVPDADPRTMVGIMSWLKVRPVLVKLLGMRTGPFASISSETTWSVTITTDGPRMIMNFQFGQIDLVRGPEAVLRDTCQRLESWSTEPEVNAFLKVDLRDWEAASTATAIVEVPRARPLADAFQGLTEFVAYLTAESSRILRGGSLSRNFYSRSKELFVKPNDAVFQAPASEWVEFVRQLLDLQYATTASWLLLPPRSGEDDGRHPRTAVHQLYNKLQLDIRGEEISDEQIARIRGEVFQLAANIRDAVRAEIHGADERQVDVSVIAEQAVREIAVKIPEVNFSVFTQPETFAMIYPPFLASALGDLLDNAAKAVLVPGIEKNVAVSVALSKQKREVSITVSNPYDPEHPRPATSTGIGLQEVHYLIRNLSGGKVEIYEDAERGQYEVCLQLPAVTDEPLVEEVSR
ncbi:MAG TPA: tetratricopeptide repeat protein [Blastocatellia bacterium]|nr:tetratricopeptide repeat protein [Blastocatellia bacterium]